MSFLDSIKEFAGDVSTVYGIVDSYIGTESDEERGIAGGVALQQKGLAEKANTAIAAANFNNQISRMNTTRRLESQSRRTRRVLSSNRATFSASGFTATSKSAMLIQNDIINQATKKANNELVDQANKESATMFEAESAARAAGIQSAQLTSISDTKARKRDTKIQPNIETILSDVTTIGEKLSG